MNCAAPPVGRFDWPRRGRGRPLAEPVPARFDGVANFGDGPMSSLLDRAGVRPIHSTAAVGDLLGPSRTLGDAARGLRSCRVGLWQPAWPTVQPTRSLVCGSASDIARQLVSASPNTALGDLESSCLIS